MTAAAHPCPTWDGLTFHTSDCPAATVRQPWVAHNIVEDAPMPDDDVDPGGVMADWAAAAMYGGGRP